MPITKATKKEISKSNSIGISGQNDVRYRFLL
jgi:hypothetical protein